MRIHHKKTVSKKKYSSSLASIEKYFKPPPKKSTHAKVHHKRRKSSVNQQQNSNENTVQTIDSNKSRSLGMFPQIPGTPGTESPTFPPLIPNDETPIIINSPPVELPKKQKPTDLQGHIIFVPTIIYPKKKKRVIVHHENSMMGYYNRYIHGINGYYLNWFKQNPGYADWMKENAYWKAVEKDPKMKDYLKKVHPGGKDASGGSSKSKASSMMGGFMLV